MQAFWGSGFRVSSGVLLGLPGRGVFGGCYTESVKVC